jgi:hypothetical protein
MQGRDRLHCLTRRGLAALSRNGGRSGDGRRAMEQALKPSSTHLYRLHFDSRKQRCDQSRLDRR